MSILNYSNRKSLTSQGTVDLVELYNIIIVCRYVYFYISKT